MAMFYLNREEPPFIFNLKTTYKMIYEKQTPYKLKQIERDAKIAQEYWLMVARKEKKIGERLAEKYGFSHKNVIYRALKRHIAREQSKPGKI